MEYDIDVDKLFTCLFSTHDDKIITLDGISEKDDNNDPLILDLPMVPHIGWKMTLMLRHQTLLGRVVGVSWDIDLRYNNVENGQHIFGVELEVTE